MPKFTEQAAVRALALGFTPIALDRVDFDIETMLRDVRPIKVVVIGADVIDGSYGPDYPLRLLDCLDAAVSHGIEALLVGSSFSKLRIRVSSNACAASIRGSSCACATRDPRRDCETRPGSRRDSWRTWRSCWNLVEAARRLERWRAGYKWFGHVW